MPDHNDPEHEQRLASRARDDPDALQTLYRLYVRRIYGYVAGRIDSREDAEDVVSEIFLSMVRTLDRFSNRHSYSFAAWIFTIARNAVSDYYRDRRIAEVPISPDALPQPRADDPDAALSQQGGGGRTAPPGQGAAGAPTRGDRAAVLRRAAQRRDRPRAGDRCAHRRVAPQPGLADPARRLCAGSGGGRKWADRTAKTIASRSRRTWSQSPRG
ncbi:MAG: sigma-70 family RNA polymerase sigma factor [Anaerolineae bacterium]|nr:sigma-70 family RNA polymerase sigma factor [Anaerolineae bacterium]